MRSQKHCKPKNDLVFLKTHKTGSSSIQNILFRYGDEHNLTFALPFKSTYFGHPQPFNRQMLYSTLPSVRRIRPRNSMPYNIFAHHARFDYQEMKSIMSKEVMFVSILRQPIWAFRSLLSFIHLERFYNETSLDSAMNRYLSNLSAYHVLSNERLLHRFGRNQMSFDLGLEAKDFDDREKINQFIRQLDAQFHLVMIAERMYESLVLLQHLMCWSTYDVVVFEHNVRTARLSYDLPPEIESRMRQLNTADQLLYDFFLAKFNRQVAQFGVQKMSDEVQRLKNMTQSIYAKCVKRRVPMKELPLPRGTWHNKLVSGFENQPDADQSCAKLTMYGLLYTDYLRKKAK